MERRHVLTEDDFEGGKEYEQDEVVIKITGERPNGTRAVEIQTVLTAELGPEKDGMGRSIYRLQEPTKWFFVATREEARKLNNKNIRFGNRNFQFIKREEEMIDLRLLWVPPKTKQETIKKILKCYFEKEIILEKHTGEEDAARWNIQVKKEEEHKIPHYIPISVQTGDSFREDLWFVSKRGRPLECYYCKGVGHWPVDCKKKSERKRTDKETTEQKRLNEQNKGNVYNRSFADIVKTNANRTREAITVETPKIGKNNYKQTNRERSQKQDEIDRDRRNDEKRGAIVREESTSRDGGVRRTRKDRDTPDIENETEAKRKKRKKRLPNQKRTARTI